MEGVGGEGENGAARCRNLPSKGLDELQGGAGVHGEVAIEALRRGVAQGGVDGFAVAEDEGMERSVVLLRGADEVWRGSRVCEIRDVSGDADPSGG